jgi:hypothetical protein
VKPSTKNEGDERRFFYGTIWAVCIAQPVLWQMWVWIPRSPAADVLELAVFVGICAWVAWLSSRGVLPRTRKVKPGELAVSD